MVCCCQIRCALHHGSWIATNRILPPLCLGGGLPRPCLLTFERRTVFCLLCTLGPCIRNVIVVHVLTAARLPVHIAQNDLQRPPRRMNPSPWPLILLPSRTSFPLSVRVTARISVSVCLCSRASWRPPAAYVSTCCLTSRAVNSMTTDDADLLCISAQPSNAVLFRFGVNGQLSSMTWFRTSSALSSVSCSCGRHGLGRRSMGYEIVAPTRMRKTQPSACVLSACASMLPVVLTLRSRLCSWLGDMNFTPAICLLPRCKTARCMARSRCLVT